MRCAGVPEHAQNTKGRCYANPASCASSRVSQLGWCAVVVPGALPAPARGEASCAA